jgi:hypothetical protein
MLESLMPIFLLWRLTSVCVRSFLRKESLGLVRVFRSVDLPIVLREESRELPAALPTVPRVAALG